MPGILMMPGWPRRRSARLLRSMLSHQSEYAKAGDGDSTVTSSGSDRQRSSAASPSEILAARRKSETLKNAEQWMSEGDWCARNSCTIW